ncbi:protein STU1 [Cladorrhinum samala]|uniref:Protein STU1 n=1 Tax=Cladorrhinum samala TaxID=585594 RepID=A0AAV9HCB4_9PEZI|nr:protein STU1 [Cladorrhinum samala]
MAERITEDQVADLFAVLRNDSPIDIKVNHVNAVKSSIKQHNVPDTCVVPLFDVLRTASSSQHAILVNAGFTALNHLLTRMSRQDQKWLAKNAGATLPLLVEKLSDQKDKFRQLAVQALGTMYKVAPLDTERAVRNTAMVGKNPKAKEASLHWLLQMHQENGLQFRGYVPTLMELLEDADPMVREATKSTVIELFKNAPNAAKSDLKRQLKNFKVRPAIEQAIIRELIPTTSAPTAQTSALEEPPAPRSNLSASASSLPTERPITPMDNNRADTVEPMYVNTHRELDDIFREMHLHFDGRETEQNWMKREESITKLRRLIAGNAVTDFGEPFLAGLQGLRDGMIKGVVSLRTSLSKESCNLIQEIAKAYGPAMDPMVEILMQTFIKLCAATKKIASQQANATVDTIIAKVTYTPRIMQHIWLACQDKNVQPRLYACGWLQTLLIKEAHHKHHVEHTGGLDLIEKSIKKGLADANPGVREKMRATYWKFSTIWPARADAIMDGLDSTAQKLLRNDPHNPSSPKRTAAAPAGGARPGLGLSKSTMGPPKPSIREAIMAQKKAMASGSGTTKGPPARPGSAMSHFSPVRTTSSSSHAPTGATTSTIRTRPESTVTSSTGGLSGAPVRPGRKRPEMAPRPATAGPYSVRSHDQPSSEQRSPTTTRPKSVIAPKPISTSPKRSLPKGFHPAQSTSSELSLPSPVRASTPSLASPRATPSRLGRSVDLIGESSPSKAHEEFSAVIPSLSDLKTTPPRERQTSLAPIDTQHPQVVRAVSEPPPYEESGGPEVPKHTSPLVKSAGLASPATLPSPPIKVYEDPLTEEQKKASTPIFDVPVLEDKPVNADAANLQRSTAATNGDVNGLSASPEKTKQNIRLLESGITKVKQKSLDVHGFRKLQGIIRDNKAVITDDKFDALLLGLFEFLEAPLPNFAADKVQDVKAQILATIKVLLKRMRENFRPHVSRGLESLLRSRAAYEGRTHMVSGLELLAAELVTLGDASEITLVLSKMLSGMGEEENKSLSMGLHVLKEMMDGPGGKGFVPTDGELEGLAALAARCLESTESSVRMDAVLLCVALHSRVGDTRFWDAVKGVREDPKSLITYYIVRRQREEGGSGALIGTGTATAATPAA